MKRILALILTVTFILSAASCGKNGSGDGDRNPTFGYESVTLEGVDVRDCVIAVSNKIYKNRVSALVKELSRYTGRDIPVKLLSDLTDSDERIILIGAAYLDGSHERYWGIYGYKIAAPDDERIVVSVDFANVGVISSAVDRLVSLLSRRTSGGVVTLTLRQKELIGNSFEDGLPLWMLKEETTSTVTDGVTYTFQLFYDEDGLPYRAHVLKIDPSKVYIYTGTSNDGYAYTLGSGERQNVKQHINAAVGNGTVPVAAVNGDFFEISGDYHPKGLCIKEGTVVSEPKGRPWFGYTYDGRFVCGNSDLYKQYAGELRSAVGASHILVMNGYAMTSGINGTHPRTLAGITEDGILILAVIDGRQSTVSNGAEFGRCAAFMMSHGAYNAVNLDGGGSSTMIIYRDGEYETVNSPSDGHLRKVYNSLLIVPKDN